MKTETAPTGDVFRACLDAFPAPTFIVDDEVRLHYFNTAARLLLGPHPDQAFLQRGGEVWRCIHAVETPAGCGHTAACERCVVRNAVNAAVLGARFNRQVATLWLQTRTGQQQVFLLITAAPCELAGCTRVLLVLENIDELIQLRKMLTSCVRCKTVRSDAEFWAEAEAYFQAHRDTHGICPQCMRTLRHRPAPLQSGVRGGVPPPPETLPEPGLTEQSLSSANPFEDGTLPDALHAILAEK